MNWELCELEKEGWKALATGGLVVQVLYNWGIFGSNQIKSHQTMEINYCLYLSMISFA
jgi:hypothetical protein